MSLTNGNDTAASEDALMPLGKVPDVRSEIGIGLMLLGRMRLTETRDDYIAQLWMTVLWLPLIPLGFYVVRRASDTQLQLIAKYRFKRFFSDFGFVKIFRFYLGIYGKALAILLLIAAVLGIKILQDQT